MLYCSLIIKMKLVPPSLPRSSYVFFRPFGLYCSPCFGSLFVSILCTCCSHFSWYCFISFTMFCAPVFCLIHRFFSLSSFVIPSKCLKTFICAASKHCSSLFFSTQASLPNGFSPSYSKIRLNRPLRIVTALLFVRGMISEDKVWIGEEYRKLSSGR